jgi:hypothetical protein
MKTKSEIWRVLQIKPFRYNDEKRIGFYVRGVKHEDKTTDNDVLSQFLANANKGRQETLNLTIFLESIEKEKGLLKFIAETSEHVKDEEGKTIAFTPLNGGFTEIHARIERIPSPQPFQRVWITASNDGLHQPGEIVCDSSGNAIEYDELNVPILLNNDGSTNEDIKAKAARMWRNGVNDGSILPIDVNKSTKSVNVVNNDMMSILENARSDNNYDGIPF